MNPVYSEKLGRYIDNQRSKIWSTRGVTYKGEVARQGGLPICPYGCGREGTFLEAVRQDDGRYLGIFNDHPCDCIFVADIELGEPPTNRKMIIGPDGELHETSE